LTFRKQCLQFYLSLESLSIHGAVAATSSVRLNDTHTKLQIANCKQQIPDTAQETTFNHVQRIHTSDSSKGLTVNARARLCDADAFMVEAVAARWTSAA
jgi:hypothetical protein